jgi:hypothetical protein
MGQENTTTSDVELDALDRIEKWLDLMSPKDSGHPFWGQEPYRGMLFAIFAETYPKTRLHGDRITDHFGEEWRREHSEKEWETLHDICRAWSEWLYAWDKHPSSVDSKD